MKRIEAEKLAQLEYNRSADLLKGMDIYGVW